MPKFSRDCDVVCPYYVCTDADRHNSIYITCEGIAGTTSNSIRFNSRADRNKYMDEHCNLYPNSCGICKLNDSKYL